MPSESIFRLSLYVNPGSNIWAAGKAEGWDIMRVRVYPFGTDIRSRMKHGEQPCKAKFESQF